MKAELRRVAVEPIVELAENSVEVLGDRTQLQQVILNLTVNSIEAMAHASNDRRELRIAIASRQDGFGHVEVADTGPGPDPNSKDRLFDAFFTTKPGGIGMGLSICRSIIEAHGGKIWASPNPSGGCRFEFTVPLAPEREHAKSWGAGKF